MNQILLGNFQLVINDKLFQYSFMPPATFDDLYKGLEQFKIEIDALKAKADEEEAAKKAAEQPAEEAPVEVVDAPQEETPTEVVA